ncbi:MAG: helix-turn-helix domain-containing protein [Hydrogenophaga sp.]|nr:helix-turn-helix domain-containing protein [Hydrogenophaga sp.]MDO9482331.1 helix-turn-helix domain-containing protein [Hydrogenophaga sp.]MDP3346621.1 helix-turn-helix domain-containing protein [Hydrogenophaga sp.]MDP3807653.1 helix-turn-helix domain-containing protein [Hydrogenophaga sp.]MDP3925647.1 helix-turn-helix domain-containing protein [Hydrogenophaga sp.]MDZ4122982.1 helix-turn-helix domain-containing protein [Hydrogenophaga sp.]
MHAEPWASVEQVAQHIGVAKDTVYRWREHKGLPAHRMGRLWKFKLTEVDQWVMAGGAAEEAPSTPEPAPAIAATKNQASHGNP